MDGICYILSGNLYLCPYLKSLYLKNAFHDHDSIIYWDREGLDEDSLGLHPYRFPYYLNDSSSTMNLLQGYLSFRRFVNRIIRENRFSRIVLLNTIAGYCAYPAIVARYSGKYILDVRDYGGEHFAPLGMVSRQLAKKAGLTVLSSKYYHEFLGYRFQCQYVHNIQVAPDDLMDSCRRRLLDDSRNRRITIAYIGTVKPYLENHKHLIDCLGGDCRFMLKFIGSGSDELVQYCEERSVDNVEIHGRFAPEEMFDLYHDVDMIHNLYGNRTPFLDYALSNKLYISAQLGLPILVCPDTAMEAESHRYGIGFTVDLYASSSGINLGDALWNYYQNIDARQFLDGCDRLLDNARVQDEKTVTSIKRFLTCEQ